MTASILFRCQEFGPSMCAAGKGSIVNIAIVAAHLPSSRVVAYSAAKAAALEPHHVSRPRMGTVRVCVNSITSGFFPAIQNRHLPFADDDSPTPRATAILNQTAIGRFGEAQELAGAVVFLASDTASGFVTGTDIRVDGGVLCQTI